MSGILPSWKAGAKNASRASASMLSRLAVACSARPETVSELGAVAKPEVSVWAPNPEVVALFCPKVLAAADCPNAEGVFWPKDELFVVPVVGGTAVWPAEDPKGDAVALAAPKDPGAAALPSARVFAWPKGAADAVLLLAELPNPELPNPELPNPEFPNPELPNPPEPDEAPFDDPNPVFPNAEVPAEPVFVEPNALARAGWPKPDEPVVALPNAPRLFFGACAAWPNPVEPNPAEPNPPDALAAFEAVAALPELPPNPALPKPLEALAAPKPVWPNPGALPPELDPLAPPKAPLEPKEDLPNPALVVCWPKGVFPAPAPNPAAPNAPPEDAPKGLALANGLLLLLLVLLPAELAAPNAPDWPKPAGWPNPADPKAPAAGGPAFSSSRILSSIGFLMNGRMFVLLMPICWYRAAMLAFLVTSPMQYSMSRRRNS